MKGENLLPDKYLRGAGGREVGLVGLEALDDVLHVLHICGKCSHERPTRGTVCGTQRSMFGADAGCLAMNATSISSSNLWSGVVSLGV